MMPLSVITWWSRCKDAEDPKRGVDVEIWLLLIYILFWLILITRINFDFYEQENINACTELNIVAPAPC